MDLTKAEIKELKSGKAELLICTNCGKKVYYGSMQLISLAIMNRVPVCSYNCNKSLGQVK